MSKIVNLRQARKQRTRQEQRSKGDRNAAKFGQTKHERSICKAEDERAAALHKAHKLDD